jgi:CO dehydrogenase maturation factor
MGFTVAVSGKGGTGKSTIAALVVSELVAAKDGSVLAVDADPNFNLGLLLGQEVGETAADVREHFMQSKLDPPSGMSKERAVEYGIQRAVQECGGFDLLTMGRPEGPGCYCAINNILRRYLDVLSSDYSYVVVDNEAGMEHLSRRTTNRVDLLLVATQPSPASLAAVERIIAMSRNLPVIIKKREIVLNQVKGEIPDIVEGRLSALGAPVAARMEYDPALEEATSRGESLLGKSAQFVKNGLSGVIEEIRAGGKR